MKILIADDDPVSRHLMRSILERFSFEVSTAEDGLQATRELLSHGGPRLALIDWMMPGLDGPGVCREMRRHADEPYRYLLLLTSRQSSEDIVQGLEAGADDFLTKPCRPAELKARLDTGRRILQLQDKLVEAREAMRHRATRDSLTSLWNRSSILGFLREALHHAPPADPATSVLLCDVDHFKRINDRFGHNVGDQVLREVAARLQSAVRSRDHVGRYGGEEFLIVLNDCDASNLSRHAERVRAAVTHQLVDTDAGMIEVSVSIGAAPILHLTEGLTVESVVRDADKALYQAKDLGRNQICLAESLAFAS